MCQDPAGSRTPRKPLDHRKKIFQKRKPKWYGYVSRSSGLAKTHLARHNEKRKKTRQTENEVRGQHQGIDRPAVRQVPEGSGEQRTMEEAGCEIICGAPTTLAVKGEVKVKARINSGWDFLLVN